VLFAIGIGLFGQIGAGPMSFDFVLAPGESASGVIQVMNNGDKPREFQVKLSDYDRDLEGHLVLMAAGSHPRSLAKWLLVSPQHFTLEPGKTQPVSFTVTIPNSESGPHWSALLISSPVPSDSGSQGEEGEEGVPISIGAAEQFIIKIRHTDPTSAVNDGRITDITVLPPQGDQPLRVVVGYENTGTTFQQPKVELRIVNSRGEFSVVQHAAFAMLPGGKRRLVLPVVEELAPGEYLALVIIDFGGDYLLAAQARFSLPASP